MSDRTITSSYGTRRDGEEPPAAQLVLIFQCDRLGDGGMRHVIDDLDTVRIERGERGIHVDSGQRASMLLVPDSRMSRPHARITRIHRRWVLEDAGSKNGTLLNGCRVRRAQLGDGDVLQVGYTFFLFRDAVPAGGPGASAFATPQLQTHVASLAERYAALAQIAASDVPILLIGETGSGKEVVARALHTLSSRRGAFVAINCAAIPPTLLEAELFGHRRGAFSGAVEDRLGLIRTAHNGTLFLDEIGELAPTSQAALLRAIQEREVVPVGEYRPVRVDVRVLSATNRDIDRDRGGLRSDLYARLAGFVCRLPPLRERREDLGLLIAAILHDLDRDRGRARALDRHLPRRAEHAITPAAAARLLHHDWPLNVRELEQCLRSSIALATRSPIDVSHLPEALRRDPAPVLSSQDEALRDTLVASLVEHRGNVAAVARDLGKGRMQIHRWARRLRLQLDVYRRP